MKKFLMRTGILLLVFIAGVIGFSSFLNKEVTDNKMDMEGAKQPLLSMLVDDVEVNRMHGYVQEMQADFMRDSLTPVGTDKKFTVAVTPYGHKIDNLVYEVRTTDGSEVIENAKIKNFKEKNEMQTAEIVLEKSLLMNQEYSLIFTVNTDKGSYHYYTRLLQRSGLNTGKYLEFASAFSQKTFSKENRDDLLAYLEPDETNPGNNFNNIDIHSSVDMVTWGDLKPKIVKKGVPIIKDINEETGSIFLTYYISAKNTEGNQEYYQVDEFYRMRYDGNRIRLLNFERGAKEIFQGNNQINAKDRLDLGVTSRNVQYVNSRAGDVVAFVVQGDLWTYNKGINKLTRVFSFREDGNPNVRNDYPEHDIKIVRVGETGDVDFVLYGYMNRGEYEGYVGTAVYHYGSEQNVLEEKFFLPSTKSYEFLKKDLEKLSYVSTDDHLYLLLDHDLYQINMEEKTYTVLKENIREDSIVVSSSHKSVAWMEEMDPYQSETITFMNLEENKTSTVKAKAGTKIRAVGFINEDLVYGIANNNDILPDADGNMQFAMHEICIVNNAGELMKDYQQDRIYIMDVRIQQGLIELIRAQWRGSAYREISSDHIMNNVKNAEEAAVSSGTTQTGRRGTIICLVFNTEIGTKNPLIIQSKLLVKEKDTVLNMALKEEKREEYYVYAKGGLENIYTNPAQAVIRADELTGVVLNRNQQYVWERGNLKTKANLNLDDIPEIFKSGTLNLQVLQDELGDEGTVIDLTGCTQEEILYQISAQRPVIVKAENNETKVIVGYDQYNTLLYDPKTGETKYCGLGDGRKMFEEAGNVFISYIDNIRLNDK